MDINKIKGKIEKKLILSERSYEKKHRMKIKRSEDYQVLEEVFDKPTLMTLYHLINKGAIDHFSGVVNAGKESKVYHATNPKGEELAVKIYLTVSAEFKRGMIPYIEGDIRFFHIKKKTYSLVYAWALKEFRNLSTAHHIGVRVPKPYSVEKNVLLLEFIGKKGIPAPLLKDVSISKPTSIYEDLLENIKVLYRDGELVHGDLSEYNIMMNENELVIFDMSQSVLTSHPLADQLLRRDIANINRYFSKINVKTKSEKEIHRWIIGNGSSS